MSSVLTWLPPKDKAVEEYIHNCDKLNALVDVLETKLGSMLCDVEEAWEDLDSITSGLDVVGKLFTKVSGDHRPTIVDDYKCRHWRKLIDTRRLSVSYLLNAVVTIALARYLGTVHRLIHVLKLIVFYDTILPLGSGAESKSTSIIRNSCPLMLLPMRKLTLTKILQVIAQIRAEECGQQLVYILMKIKAESDAEECDPDSDSSLEVYKALTQNLSPTHVGSLSTPPSVDNPPKIVAEMSLLESLIAVESYKLKPLMETMAAHAPDRLGPNTVKPSKGGLKMTSRAKVKVVRYYQEILWGTVGAFAEYSLIWKGIGFYGDICGKWTAWLKKFSGNVNLPQLLKPALQSLIDGLCVHLTTVTWDFMFRKALVTSGHQNSTYVADNVLNGTKAGLLYKELFSELVVLSNSCEGSNWTVAALEELPLTEQIPILHRLDHSVHTARLWAESKARQLSNAWNMDQVFRVSQVDVKSCLDALEKRHFASQVDLLGPECSVHVIVCGKMRAKLVSEVQANVDKLKSVPQESIEILSSVCRVYSLANLKLMFPEARYWRQQFDEIPQFASAYVEDYLDVVLKPVIQATTGLDGPTQQRVSCLVLDIMCEAWLDHIYQYRIKFSEWGALQLLADFGAVPTWLMERVQATPNLLCTEMLRRCEGVGRLLLSQPGHRVPMVDKTIRKFQSENDGSPQRMPPEMYVPNQTQWLELRARKQNMFSLCCPIVLDPA